MLDSGGYRYKIPIMLYKQILFINWNEGERLSASIKWLDVCGCLRMDQLIDMKQAPKAQKCVMGELKYYMAVFDVVIKLFWRKTEKRIGHRQYWKTFYEHPKWRMCQKGSPLLIGYVVVGPDVGY